MRERHTGGPCPRVLAIDPGTTQSAWVIVGASKVPLEHGIDANEDLVRLLRNTFNGRFLDARAHGEMPLACEMIASYGMTVGKTVFETCVWIGRFIEAWGADRSTLVYRREVKMHLCGNIRAKDSNIRQALIDLYGGDRSTAVGTKRSPGPLYGVRKDIWAALGVAVTYVNTVEITALAAGA
jgi:hypothetical protein